MNKWIDALFDSADDYSVIVTAVWLYRLRTNVLLNGDLVPVTRDYRVSNNGDRKNSHIWPHKFSKDRLEFENVNEESTFWSEVVGEIYGKKLLFLPRCKTEVVISPYFIEFSPKDIHWVADYIQSELDKIFGGNKIRVGMLGSQHLALNAKDSDFDFIISAPDAFRSEIISIFNEIVKRLWFQREAKNRSHITRYSEAMDIPESAACYLANKRNRWEKGGLGLSLQYVDIESEHAFFQEIFNGIGKPFDMIPIDTECRVIDASKSFNCFKFWKLEIDGSEVNAFSFHWRHQGMWHDEGVKWENYIIKAFKITNDSGSFIFLPNQGTYLIPKKILNW